LPPLGGGVNDGDYSSAFAINNAGIIVGQSSYGYANSFPTVWHPGQNPLSIGGSGTPYALGQPQGSAINRAGFSVGHFVAPDGWLHAFLWDGVLHDLNDLIEPTSGWYLGYATSINDRGQIVGVGVYRDPADPNAPPIHLGAFF